jgi:hypothetical protein
VLSRNAGIRRVHRTHLSINHIQDTDVRQKPSFEKLINGLSDEEDEEDSEHDGAQGHDYGGSSLHSLVENEKTTAAKPQVGSWLDSLEPTAAPLMVAAAV